MTETDDVAPAEVEATGKGEEAEEIAEYTAIETNLDGNNKVVAEDGYAQKLTTAEGANVVDENEGYTEEPTSTEETKAMEDIGKEVLAEDGYTQEPTATEEAKVVDENEAYTEEPATTEETKVLEDKDYIEELATSEEKAKGTEDCIEEPTTEEETKGIGNKHNSTEELTERPDTNEMNCNNQDVLKPQEETSSTTPTESADRIEGTESVKAEVDPTVPDQASADTEPLEPTNEKPEDFNLIATTLEEPVVATVQNTLEEGNDGGAKHEGEKQTENTLHEADTGLEATKHETVEEVQANPESDGTGEAFGGQNQKNGDVVQKIEEVSELLEGCAEGFVTEEVVVVQDVTNNEEVDETRVDALLEGEDVVMVELFDSTRQQVYYCNACTLDWQW